MSAEPALLARKLRPALLFALASRPPVDRFRTCFVRGGDMRVNASCSLVELRPNDLDVCRENSSRI